MFYEHNQVEDILNCPNCNERYDRPLLLPCFKSICNKCVENIRNYNSISCPFCKNSHDLPKNGFPLNDALFNLLKIKPVDVHRAELFRRIGDLIKKMQSNMDEIEFAEKTSLKSLVDYFDLIKNEIETSTKSLIDQAINYRDKLLIEIDYLKNQSIELLTDLFKKDGHILSLKSFCNTKKIEWQLATKHGTSNLDESKINSIIHEADQLNSKLNDSKKFIQTTLTSNKLVFNQREPNYFDKSSTFLIGQLDFNTDFHQLIDHKLKIKYLNEFHRVKICQMEPELLRKTSFLVPLLFRRLLNISKCTYDEVSDINLSVIDPTGRVFSENKENNKCIVNSIATYLDYVLVSLTDTITEREMLKLYNSSMQLISSTVIEFKCNSLYMNESNVYAKLDSDYYPFVYKFNYNLEKQPIFESFSSNPKSELFVSFVVDDLVYISSNTNRIYFCDKCYSTIKIYSEINGCLLQSIHIDNLRDSKIYVDDSFLSNQLVGGDNDDYATVHSEQFICFNMNDRHLRLYNENGDCISKNKIDDNILNITDFYLTQDGSYVFVDTLNDSVYFY